MTQIRSDGHCLVHHGIKGQRWGVRRYQNKDGTLTKAGKQHTQSEQNKSNTAKKVATGVAIGAGVGLAAAGVALAVKKGKSFVNKKSSQSFDILKEMTKTPPPIEDLLRDLGVEPTQPGTSFTLKTINSKGEWKDRIFQTR